LVHRNNPAKSQPPAQLRIFATTNCGPYADFTLSRADGAGMKVLIALVLAFSFYAIGCADGRNRQIQTPTAIHQLPQ